MSSPKLYEAQLLAARLRQLNLAANQRAVYDAILREAHTNVTRLLESIADTSGTLKAARLRQIRGQLTDIINNTVDDIRDSIIKDMTLSVEISNNGRKRGAMAYLHDLRPDLANRVPASFATVPNDAIKAILARTFDDGLTFSDRIWKLRQYSNNVISKTIARGLAEGKSVWDIQKELEAFLLMTADEERAFARVWAEKHTPEWKADWKTRKRLKYNVERLARTEMNNAFRESAIQSAKRAPWVRGLKWNLSASHPKPDICDDWASADNGMGPGVYAPNDVPQEHPNGFCYLTDELVSEAELQDILVSQIAA